jgi:hypothetical protein
MTVDEGRLQQLEAALRLIEKFRDGRWCERFTGGSCISDPGLTANAPYGADQWCDACVAHAALNGIEVRLHRPQRCPPAVWAELNRFVPSMQVVLSDEAKRWLKDGTVQDG